MNGNKEEAFSKKKSLFVHSSDPLRIFLTIFYYLVDLKRDPKSTACNPPQIDRVFIYFLGVQRTEGGRIKKKEG